MFGSCLACQRSYEITVLRGNIACPKCEGNLVEIDDLLAPTILLLNHKGYKTQYCCSGHLCLDQPRVHTYVVFDDAILRYIDKDKFVRSLPDSFYVCEMDPSPDLGPDPRITIRFRPIKAQTTRHKLTMLFRANLELLIWAEKLEPVKLTDEQVEEIRRYREDGHDYLSRIKAWKGTLTTYVEIR